MDISKHTRTRNTGPTLQTQPIPGEEARQVENSAGGFVYALDKWLQLQRFLILGTEGGTYYTGERDLTKANHDNLLACIAEAPMNVVSHAHDVSTKNRAPKNDYAIYVLALVAAKSTSLEARQFAWRVMPEVCRIGTHLFQFAQYFTAFRGWSRMSRKGIANWYLNRSPNSLANQLLKYQQRNGWAHRDLIRLAHVKTDSGPHNDLLRWSVKGDVCTHPLIWAHRNLHEAWQEGGPACVTRAIVEHKLTHEMLPTELLAHSYAWGAMLPHMGATALIRNLGRMTANGTIGRFASGWTKQVAERLEDPNFAKEGRLHPFNILLALSQYKQGHGDKGSLTWTPVDRVMDALNVALDNSFATVEPTGKRILHALDISGSMSAGVMGTQVSCAAAECVMALASVRAEPHTEVIAFDREVRKLPFTQSTRLADAFAMMKGWQGGNTDCSVPMRVALTNNWNVDAFVIWTDNETWAGEIHAMQALREYRKRINPAAKMIVCGMTSTGFTIADPQDAGTLDIVGMDTSVPAVIRSMLVG